MPALYEVRFEPSGTVQRICGSRGNYYELDDGIRIDLHSRPVWCVSCAKMTPGEELEAIEFIDSRIAELERIAGEIRKMMASDTPRDPTAQGDAHTQEQIAKMRKRRRWRETRRTPPKCIVCGSSDLIAPLSDEPTPIPGRPGETFFLRVVGLCSNQFNQWFFTPEGQRIERETPPQPAEEPSEESKLDDDEWVRQYFPEMRE